MKQTISFFALLFVLTACNNKTSNTETKVEKQLVKKDSLPKVEKVTDLHKVSKDCIEMVFELIKSSEHFKELTDGLNENIIANGGTGFGFTVETSPNPNLDNANEKGDYYEISVHESYPDHMTNIAHYRFDRHQKMLFVLNIVTAEYEEINFNHQLIADFNLACKE
ncbi:hypothetical protein H1R17_09465 [Flavobacterium sp. xlx-214]|uniref:hypothetical protein n=1 Tax=unclassified Flavobacterium TaxID=196869 RepID=UPI0013D38261|nr:MULTISPECIES: hypothetical protein [unclassified Flavobacterium]MBA5793535.1 hypothetical protein [Flavobacterium sp. xlx-221]QMI82696.1 hypothetical protein H1R17_09465 [Flavobacterium sp. xlx-214]